eukprot:GHVQ01012796.1.p1 GENE.GHVQ01012796.1~~GHVQ01012796.1.p1  ORF type:complete len:326 (-),score=75.40 GHVQ01012796.1:461-1438(-)
MMSPVEQCSSSGTAESAVVSTNTTSLLSSSQTDTSKSPTTHSAVSPSEKHGRPSIGPNTRVTRLAELGKERERIENKVEALSLYLQQPNYPGVKGGLIDKEGFPRADIDVIGVRTARHELACLNTDYALIMKDIEENLHVLHQEEKTRRDLSQQEEGGELSSNSSVPSTDNAQTSDVAGMRTAEARVCVSHLTNGREEDYPLEVFGLVDEVTADSPAWEAGLRVGDQVRKFGRLAVHRIKTTVADAAACQHGTADLPSNKEEAFSRLKNEVLFHENRRVELEVLRQTASTTNGSGEESEVLTLEVLPRRWPGGGQGILGCHLIPC